MTTSDGSMPVGIIDYGVGNLGSMMRALEDIGVDARLLTEPAGLGGFDRLILPGVGNFTECMQRLGQGGWSDPLRRAVRERGTMLLGVCVGMQLLAETGAEGAAAASGGVTPGLGLIPGHVEHLRKLGCGQRIPHVGWNSIGVTHTQADLFASIPDGTDFYFVHSYAFVADSADDVIARTSHGIEITAAVNRGRVWGTQFHPEKSSKAGQAILRNFAMLPQC